MSSLSHFQRYSKKENHVTNNTLLLLRYFYEASPNKLQSVLNKICDADFEIGLQFTQQTRKESSVPDGEISQPAFSVLIETKLNDQLNMEQMARHADSANIRAENGCESWVVGLTSSAVSKKQKNELKTIETNIKNRVRIVSITFSDFVDMLFLECLDHETSLKDMLADYVEFLQHSNLIEYRDKLTVIPCGKSIDLNKELNLYFEPSTRPSRESANYIGLYADKEVRFIGKTKKIILATNTGDAKNIDMDYFDDNIGESEKKFIEEAVRIGEELFPGFSQFEHRYYLFVKLHELDFVKKTKHGLQGKKNFWLKELMPTENWNESISVESVVAGLKGKEF